MLCVMTQDFLNDFAEQNNFVAAIRVSAKTGLNISSCFSQLVREIFVREIQASALNNNNGGGAASLYGDNNSGFGLGNANNVGAKSSFNLG